MSDSLYPMDCSLPGSSVPGIFQASMGCHFLLQGIFLTQGSNSGLLHCRQTLYRVSHQGSPTDDINTKSYSFGFIILQKFIHRWHRIDQDGFLSAAPDNYANWRLELLWRERKHMCVFRPMLPQHTFTQTCSKRAAASIRIFQPCVRSTLCHLYSSAM